ncbi:MAG: hypothetical protein EH225_09055, partial [Calditrichaeota bacterium]
MIRKLSLIIILFLLIDYGSFKANKTESESFRVSYVSAENVYLDAGKLAGLNIGDKLTIQRNGENIGQVKIVYLADYSASAVVVNEEQPIQPGDLAIVQDKAVESTPQPEAEPETSRVVITETAQKPAVQRSKNHRKSSFSGTISVQYYHWNDLKNSNLDFSQPTMRLSVRGRELWGKEYYLRIRGRLRHNQRERRLHTNAPESEWRNRIYELSFSYTHEDAFINYQIGRIISNKFSGVGYIDGVLFRMNPGGIFHAGAFAGTQPEWQYADFQTDIQKYGGYVNITTGEYSSGLLESTLALAGEYHRSTVSREFIYFQNNYYRSGKWNFYQSAELDINRSWRRDISGEDFSLTNLYLATQWNITSAIIVGAIYDNRKNYLTYQTRSLADSLFVEAMRQGIRGTFTLVLPENYRLFGNFGIRKRETDVESTYSYSGGLSQSNLFTSGVRVFMNFAGFSNFYTRGTIYSMTTGRTFFRR